MTASFPSGRRAGRSVGSPPPRSGRCAADTSPHSTATVSRQPPRRRQSSSRANWHPCNASIPIAGGLLHQPPPWTTTFSLGGARRDPSRSHRPRRPRRVDLRHRSDRPVRARTGSGWPLHRRRSTGPRQAGVDPKAIAKPLSATDWRRRGPWRSGSRDRESQAHGPRRRGLPQAYAACGIGSAEPRLLLLLVRCGRWHRNARAMLCSQRAAAGSVVLRSTRNRAA